MSVEVLQKRGTRYDFSGLSTDEKPTSVVHTGGGASAIGYGSTFLEEDTGNEYVYVASGWAFKSGVKEITLSFAFGAAETSKTAALGVAGILGNLQITVPAFTNSVTCTPSIKNAVDGKTIWTGPALVKGASYNPDSGIAESAYWANQIVKPTYLLVMTLSGVPGDEGGTVTTLGRVIAG